VATKGDRVTPTRKEFAQRRKAMGYTQESLAGLLGVDRTTVIRWERGASEPQPWVRRRLARALDVSLDQLDAVLTLPEAKWPHGTNGGGTTNRRSFTALTALAGFGLGAKVDLLTAPDAPRQVGLEQVQSLSSMLDDLRRADSIVGANALCAVAIEIHHRLSAWAQRSSYGSATGSALQAAQAELATQIGWLTIDAGRHQESRQYLQEAISRARIIDKPAVEVRALACLSLLTRESAPREALQCAQAAQRLSSDWGTPRLRTLLYLRAANALAQLHDSSGFDADLTRAKYEFDKGERQDDLPFLSFLTTQETLGLEGMSYVALSRPDRATVTFRALSEMPDPAHPRNTVHYQIGLADAELRMGDVTAAGRSAIAALPGVLAINSRRTSRRLKRLRDDLAPHRAVAQARAFVDLYDEKAAAV
jgi:transcriptional regulator with XRE-family HTH domain